MEMENKGKERLETSMVGSTKTEEIKFAKGKQLKAKCIYIWLQLFER